MVYSPPGCPWDNGYIESFNNRMRKECLNHNYWNTLFEAGSDTATRHPHPDGLQHHVRTDRTTNPTRKSGGLSNGDSPASFAIASLPTQGPPVDG